MKNPQLTEYQQSDSYLPKKTIISKRLRCQVTDSLGGKTNVEMNTVSESRLQNRHLFVQSVSNSRFK